VLVNVQLHNVISVLETEILDQNIDMRYDIGAEVYNKITSQGDEFRGLASAQPKAGV